MSLDKIELALKKCQDALAYGDDPFGIPFANLITELDCAVHAVAREIDDEWASRRIVYKKQIHTPNLEDLA